MTEELDLSAFHPDEALEETLRRDIVIAQKNLQDYLDRKKAQLALERTELFKDLPIELNLGWPDAAYHGGWATAYKDGNGETHIDMRLTKEASEKFGDLAEVFHLRSIGFSGVQRRPSGT